MPQLATDSKYKKAFIQVLNAQGKVQEEIPVLFNPNQYSMEKNNEFATINIPGLESPLLQFVRGGLETLSMDLLFDTYTYLGGTDVREFTNKIENLLKIDSELHAPPVLRFVWGDLNFSCVLSRLNRRFTMFDSEGKPVRATLSVTFNEFRTEADIKETKQHSTDKTKHLILKQGDSLWQISADEYGDAIKWKIIAEANSIDDPLALQTGREIIIPPLEK